MLNARYFEVHKKSIWFYLPCFAGSAPTGDVFKLTMIRLSFDKNRTEDDQFCYLLLKITYKN